MRIVRGHFNCALVLLLLAATASVAQLNLHPHEYGSSDELKAQLAAEYNVVAEGSGTIDNNPCYVDPTSRECEQRILKEQEEAKNAKPPIRPHGDQANKDVGDYDGVVIAFEQRTNDWCCAVTGKPLFTVSGDRDVLNYMYYFLSQVFDFNSQNYAGQLVLKYHTSRDDDMPKFNCEAVTIGDQSHYAAPIDATLGLRESLGAWLKKNDVNPKPILRAFVPQARQLYTKFLRSRMLFANTTQSTSEAAIMAIMPLVEKTDQLDYCEAGGEFSTLIAGPQSIKFKAALDEMIQTCVDNGKLAKNPAEYGAVLLGAKRDKEARMLFNVAVERGVLCNAWQRPESLHRKDLPAAAFWPLKKLPSVKKAFTQLGEVLRATARAKGGLEFIGFRGNHTRVPIFSRMGVNQTLCRDLGDDGCAATLQAANTIITHNDGYEIACNGSLTIEVWRFAPSHTEQRSNGATNIVLQAVLPLNGRALALQVGEDSTLVEGDATEPVVYDDSFEHILSTEATGNDGDAYFLHAQICHPSMHDKVLDIPTNECADFDDDA